MKILMVCLGNICRSPLAEGILQAKLGNDFQVDSAGTADYHEGESPDYRSIETARSHGLDISNQKARMLSAKDLEDFDLIFAMDESNYSNILKLAKTEEQKAKVKMILEFNPETTLKEVPDPYYGSNEGFEYIYKLLDQTAEYIVQDLKNKA